MKKYTVSCYSGDGIEYDSDDGEWIKADDFEKFLVTLSDYLYPSKHFGANECLETIGHLIQRELKEMRN